MHTGDGAHSDVALSRIAKTENCLAPARATTFSVKQKRVQQKRVQQKRVQQKRVRQKRVKPKAITGLLVMAFLCLTLLTPKIFAANNGDILTNLVVLTYTSNGTGVSSTVDVVFVDPSLPTAIGPTALALNCEIEPDCNSLIVENAVGQILGSLSATDADQATGHVFTVLDDDRFEVVTGKLKLKATLSVDFEVAPTIALTVRVVDAAGNIFDQVLVLNIRDVNEPPLNIVVDNRYVPPGSPGLAIGNISVEDPDLGEQHSYQILDDARFLIVDSVLRLAPDISLEADVRIPLAIIVTDKGGLTARLDVTVTTIAADIDRPRTSAVVTFLAPDPAGRELDIAPSACVPPAEFVVGQAEARDLVISQSGFETTVFAETAAYAVGDPLFISVKDADQNVLRLERETVTIKLSVATDSAEETVTLLETAVDSGEFVGYAYSTSQAPANNDCALTVAAREIITAVYTDVSDASDQQIAEALIAPVSFLFDDRTGLRVNGVILQLLDAVTDKPAAVRGDGPTFAIFPSSVRTGEPVSDAAGLIYVNAAGEYRFPSVPAGDYRLNIFNDQGLTFSNRPDAELQQLGNSAARSLVLTSTGPFRLSEASRGKPFHLSQGSMPRVDIAVQRKQRDLPPSMVTSAIIEFLQYSANPAVGAQVDVAETLCANGDRPQLMGFNNVVPPVPGVVNLLPTKTLNAGHPAFVRVTDPDQNSDQSVREKITIQLDVKASGDREYLLLTETGVNTGEFVGYIQTALGDTQTASCLLGVVKDEMVETTYIDAFDEADSVAAQILVDPFGKVFSARTGEPLDGATVTLIDVSTGELAKVFGDGPTFADYPNPIVTGSIVTDAAGLVYNYPDGKYRFPFVAPGNYRLAVSTLAADLIFPSIASIEDLQSLPGAPFALGDGYDGGVFNVPIGPPVNIDLPVDESVGDMFVSKQASKSIVAIGDFLQYRLSVQNTSATQVRGSLVLDRLPKGFRYQQGSLRVSGEKVPDPIVSADGRELQIPLPAVAEQSMDITYITEVTVGATKGPAINEARVIGALVSSTNVAQARVMVTDELFRNKAILIGQVSLAQCEAEPASPQDAAAVLDAESDQGTGLAGVRLFLEDGTYVITDDKGFWHIEGIKPGTHVVQLDVDSLPARYEASPCNASTRFAGSPYSQFVDVQGGTLWRADFKVQEKAPPESKVILEQTIKADSDGLWVAIQASTVGDVAVTDVSAIYTVPDGWVIVPGTGTLDGQALSPSATIVGMVWKLGDILQEQELRFALAPKSNTQSSPMAPEIAIEVVDLRPRFGSRSTNLSAADIQALDELIISWQGKHWAEIQVVGHTDNVPVAPHNRQQFANNEVLSKARAKVVADYIKGKIVVDQITIVGAGDRYPIAVNSTVDGRSQNRRVEVVLKGVDIPGNSKRINANAEILNGESTVRLAFQSAGNKRGKTDSVTLPLNRLVGGFDRLNATVTAQAVGSWDAIEVKLMPALLATRAPDVQGLISVVDGAHLANASNSVRFDMDSRLTPKLSVDGVEVSKEQIGFRMEDEATGKTIYNYIGVSFGEPGEHELLLQGFDSFGIARLEETANILRVGDIFSIHVADVSGNIADGTSPVKIRLELRDKAGEVIPAGSELQYKSDELRPLEKNMRLSDLSLARDGDYVKVSREGVVLFNPVSRSGSYRVSFKRNDAVEEVELFVEPEKRDWIMVGIAEGTVAHRTLSGNMQGLTEAGLDDELDAEGRVAFYAKGQIKGEYVLTMAYDTAKEKRNALQQTIDPNVYYSLYGDRSAVQYDAASREKLYLKLEKDQFYALFGDFSTGLSGNELSTYSRSLTGIKSEYKGEVFEFTGFVSEANQAFVKDEIRGDGTSGIYRLKANDVLINSEKIRIETRDRFHSQDIITARQMTRYVDYNIDYAAGTLFFKEPIFSQDTAFNQVFIVVDYELEGSGQSKLNAGGRIAYKPNENVEIGVTLITEGVQGREAELLGSDLKYQIDDNTEVRAEFAVSHSELDGETTTGSAALAEITHRSENLEAKGYMREQQGGFGLGQQSGGESGTRKIGVESTYEVTEDLSISGDVYRETNLQSDSNQDVAALGIQYQADEYSVNAGLRTAVSDAGGQDQVSNQLTLGGNYRLPDGKTTLNASADTPLGGQGQAANFPQRLRVGLDYKLNDKITLKAEQEFSWGEELNSQKTRIGMNAGLWEGGELVTSVSAEDEENSQRLAAVAGLKQRWEMNDNWSFDFGVDRSQTVKDSRAPPALAVTTVYASPQGNDFTAVTFGSKFKKDAWDWATRVEYRTADTEDKMNLASDVIHNLDAGQQLLARLDVQTSDSDTAETELTGVQFGYVYRPQDSRWSLFNRLDLSHGSTATQGFNTRTQKVVNNLNANYLWREDTQIAFQYGLKYVVDNFDQDEYRGFTDLYGVEVRHDMGERWDIGFQGGRYSSYAADVADYSYGVSVGYSMARNVWMSLGYNFTGFSDQDFSASDYTAEGVFLKYRFKFDQNSGRELFRGVGFGNRD